MVKAHHQALRWLSLVCKDLNWKEEEVLWLSGAWMMGAGVSQPPSVSVSTLRSLLHFVTHSEHTSWYGVVSVHSLHIELVSFTPDVGGLYFSSSYKFIRCLLHTGVQCPSHKVITGQFSVYVHQAYDGNFLFGDILYYTCDVGHVVMGTSRVTRANSVCLADRSWDRIPINCERQYLRSV